LDHKTNAVRILESGGIPFTTAACDGEGEYMDAVSTARKLGADPETVFKTLVARNERNEVHVFVVPADCEINMKKAARAAGSKHMEMAKLGDLTALTGYVRGGCSPLGMKKKYPTVIDELAQAHERIYVNAGARGLLVLLSPLDLCRVCEAAFADVV
jgi:Cys-tRNA(Pro)/Cys-tRNA(Cys) deacylase